MLINYINTNKTTVAILKDYLDQCWKLDNNPLLEIERLKAQIESPQGGSINKSQGRGSVDREEFVAGAIDRIAVLQHGCSVAKSYFDVFNPAWERLTDDERYYLTSFYIENDDGKGIKRIMDKYHIEKSTAYRRAETALGRLSKLLFW